MSRNSKKSNKYYCTGIEQLSSRVDADALRPSCLDDENLLGVDVPNRADEVGERDGDGGKFEGRRGVCAEDRSKEDSLVGYPLIKETMSTIRAEGTPAGSLTGSAECL